jgi:hypothetical protein
MNIFRRVAVAVAIVVTSLGVQSGSFDGHCKAEARDGENLRPLADWRLAAAHR